MAERKALGRGLNALLGGAHNPPPQDGAEGAESADAHDDDGLERIFLVDIEKIQPDPEQPRKEMDEEGLRSLAASIKVHGVLQPLLLREDGGIYRIIAGERRWRAAGIAGTAALPARIIGASEASVREISLVENVQRKDLTPIEVASALQAMISRGGLTQEQCAERIGWSRVLVANRLRLLNLPDEVCGLLAAGRITEGHARALLALSSAEKRIEIAMKAADGAMTVRQIEDAVREAEDIGADERRDVPRRTGRLQTLRLPRALRDFRSRGIKISVGRRDGAARVVLDGLHGIEDAELMKAVEDCLKSLYPAGGAQ